MLLDFGADPRAMDTMSLAEITSMLKALERRRGKDQAAPMTDAAFDDLKASVAAMNLPDVRIH